MLPLIIITSHSIGGSFQEQENKSAAFLLTWSNGSSKLSLPEICYMLFLPQIF